MVAIPLYTMPRANTAESMVRVQRGQFLGLLYLDSRRPAAFSKLNRQILDAIAIQSASILDNARSAERDRERLRMDRELGKARGIQQALLSDRVWQLSAFGASSGINTPCTEVGGDYFDVFPIDEHRTAFLIADVFGQRAGRCVGHYHVARHLSGMGIGADPVRVFQRISSFLVRESGSGALCDALFSAFSIAMGTRNI